MNTRSIKLINFLSFQLSWFLAVYYHNNYAALACLLAFVLNMNITQPNLSKRMMTVLLLAAIGITNDSLLYYYNVISSPGENPYIIPLWLAGLWLAFCATLNCYMQLFNKLSILKLALIGGICGSLSYLSGGKLHAIIYNFAFIPDFIFYFLNWCILFPVLCRLSLDTKKTAN